jgi:hypothetical protein
MPLTIINTVTTPQTIKEMEPKIMKAEGEIVLQK